MVQIFIVTEYWHIIIAVEYLSFLFNERNRQLNIVFIPGGGSTTFAMTPHGRAKFDCAMTNAGCCNTRVLYRRALQRPFSGKRQVGRGKEL